MANLHRHVIVPYTVRQMYELVNDVEAYPQFLPWCRSTYIFERSDTEMVAAIEVAARGMSQSFTTRNFLMPYEKIDMELVEGPFKDFSSIWQFATDTNNHCEITLDMSFTFANRLMGMLLAKVFNHATSHMMEAFLQRAEALYSKSSGNHD